MKTKEYVQVQKSNAAALVLAILALVMSAAALAAGIIALVKNCANSAGKRVTAAEYNGFSQSDEDDDEENIGSDTLFF